MRKLVLTAVCLMCSGLWAVAQTPSSDASSGSAGSTSGQSSSATTPSSSASSSSSSPTTLDGCLSGSAGSYTLKDKATGTTYNLTGDTSSLSAHVGHEIQVSGSAASSNSSASGSSSSMSSSSNASGTTGSSASNPSGSSATGSSSGSNSFNVTSAKMVSSSCSNQ